MSKVGIPAGVVGGVGAAAYGYKKLRNRMKNVAAENAVLAEMDRTQKREFLREKEKAKEKKNKK